MVTLLLAMAALRFAQFNQVFIALSPAREALAKAASQTVTRVLRGQTVNHVQQDTHSALRVAALLAVFPIVRHVL